LLRTLGTRSGELHRALATRTGDPAFDPEPIAAADLERWKAGIRAEAATTLDLLATRRGQLVAPARDDAAELLERRKALLARIERVGLPRGAALKTRFHGDYHRGQVLLTRLDFLIIDFEGEPARSFEERRAKHTPLKDVAGMLRSFDYARWTALRQALEGHADYERLAPFAEDWAKRARAAFLGAYADAVRGSGLFADLEDVEQLLGVLELEKALYELRYELNNRPGWVGIPLAGILALSHERHRSLPWTSIRNSSRSATSPGACTTIFPTSPWRSAGSSCSWCSRASPASPCGGACGPSTCTW
jgi:maltose alpha-D-glucosyltransferase/alpha-amylase